MIGEGRGLYRVSLFRCHKVWERDRRNRRKLHRGNEPERSLVRAGWIQTPHLHGQLGLGRHQPERLQGARQLRGTRVALLSITDQRAHDDCIEHRWHLGIEG